MILSSLLVRATVHLAIAREIVKTYLESFVDKLMGPSNSCEPIDVIEFIGNLRPKQPSCTSWTNGPSLNVFWVAPDEIAERSFVRDLLGPRYDTDLIYGSNLGAESAMDAENGAIHDSSKNEEVKHLAAGLPNGGVAVLLLTLLVEPINLSNLT